MKIYTEAQVANAIHRTKRWLLEWLRETPCDHLGKAFYFEVGRSKRFTGDDIVRLIDAILTREEADIERPNLDTPGLIYFLDGGEHIKIGYTTDLSDRLKQMQTSIASKAEVLLTMPGTRRVERLLHREFYSTRSRGEWFHKSPALLDYIERQRALQFTLESISAEQ